MTKVFKLKSCFCIFFLVLFSNVKADTIPTFLYGNHPDYKESIITVTTYSDLITKTLEIVGVDTVALNGDFRIDLDLSETRLIRVDLGIYEGILYVQPGKQYEVALPDFAPKGMAEFLNPFYEPSQIFLGIRNVPANDLNYLIADFDMQYQKCLDSNYYSIFKVPNETLIDAVIDSLKLSYDTIQQDHFKQYMEYKSNWVRYVSYMRDYRYIIRDYFNDKPVDYFNVAYMDLFNQLFVNYFSFYASTSEGERIYSDIAYAKSPKYIAETFENSMVLKNDTLQELVMLKGIYDAYYSREFPTRSLTITLDSIAELTKVEYHKTIAKNIKEKVFKAKSGQPIPFFELRDSKGIYRKSTDYLANYVYLNFCSVESFTCQQDFEMLKALHDKHKNEFRIISISIDEDFGLARDYFKENGYEWMLLSYKDQKDIIDEYVVRAYPTYYLISPEGNFKMSPAAGPAENFEWQFFKMLQAKKREVKQ